MHGSSCIIYHACIVAAIGFPAHDSSCIIRRTCFATLTCHRHRFFRAWQQFHSINSRASIAATRGFAAHRSSCIISSPCITAAAGFRTFPAYGSSCIIYHACIAATKGFPAQGSGCIVPTLLYYSRRRFSPLMTAVA